MTFNIREFHISTAEYFFMKADELIYKPLLNLYLKPSAITFFPFRRVLEPQYNAVDFEP